MYICVYIYIYVYSYTYTHNSRICDGKEKDCKNLRIFDDFKNS